MKRTVAAFEYNFKEIILDCLQDARGYHTAHPPLHRQQHQQHQLQHHKQQLQQQKQQQLHQQHKQPQQQQQPLKKQLSAKEGQGFNLKITNLVSAWEPTKMLFRRKCHWQGGVNLLLILILFFQKNKLDVFKRSETHESDH